MDDGRDTDRRTSDGRVYRDSSFKSIDYEYIQVYGFSPGYWKTHPEQWHRTSYTTAKTVRSVFTVVDNRYLTNGKLYMNRDGKEDPLMDALNYQGGSDLKCKAQILLRAVAAAILNESSLHDYFPPYPSTVELIADVNAALATGNKGAITTLAGELDYWSNGIHMFP